MRRIATVSLTALTAALAVAPGAHAAARLVVKGHGFGHGIGMSQYGAMGYAQHGAGYRDILGHYYEDTAVVKLADPPDAVRVLLQSGRSVGVTGVVAAGPKKLSARSSYSARVSGGRVALYGATGRRIGTYASPLRLAAPAGGAFTLKGGAANGLANGRYRGALEVRANGSSVQAINAVGLEDYVRGVVSAESPPSWPAEALKAQAVAARSYAVTTDAGSATDGFTQYADTRSQMYKGVAAELPSTDAAVAATDDEVVAQNGKAVTTYFFSTSGGHTENVEDSFIGALPRTWLRGVDDPYDSVSPRHDWGPFTYSQSKVQAKLKGLVRGSFRGITVLQRGASPRIVRAEVNGTGGVTQVTGPQLRQRFGLYDTWATFTYISSNSKVTSSDDDGSGGSGTKTKSTTTAPASTTVPASTGNGGATAGTGIDATGGQAAAIARVPAPRLTGTFTVERGKRLSVQRRDGRGWRTVGHARVGRAGRYAATLPGPGTYRVTLGDLVGPSVNVR
ncbi:MAG TPA: SpoIID/LytB domain-containing protein [Baekduia sp.]|uniref:SpoIID/LytB domain-containing protein n=1 Tax=Baekduia sp. TaxID=2600305 RepID=UPI002D771930|nr:SpoIID/LytB domain-containing protein [Baekduia sp.]HET6508672.1 SpoIID/LytB domain-containing protein [Baekduia sp.]